MKKFLSMVLVMCIILSMSSTCFARSVGDDNLGITFEVSDNWDLYSYEDFSIKFNYYNTLNESICVEGVKTDWAYSMDMVEESALVDLCNDIYSNASLADELSDENGVYVTVSTESILKSYEYYNGVKYFRYEKAYTARAYGYNDTPFYETAFVTAKNGIVYFITYHRNSVSNHFNDVVALLDSISFEPGEIKILIDGERIYPDNAPILLEGRTLVPIRAVAEKMGYYVDWDGENELVTLISNDGSIVLHFQIDNNVALKNLEERISLDVPPLVIEGRTYLPLRAVAEAMETYVDWNEAENAVEIWQ